MKRLGEGTLAIILQTREPLRLRRRILKVTLFSPASPPPSSDHTHRRSAEMSRTSTRKLLDTFVNNLVEETVPFVMSQSAF